jgi:hypothetical protein
MGLAGRRRQWTLLGTSFRCLGMPAAAAAELSALLQGFSHSTPWDGPMVDFEVHEGEATPEITLDGVRWKLGTADPVASQVEYVLVNEALRRTRDRYVLHAGGVVAPAGTCLIIGESGAGKTSLTLWLWASGFRLLTDDLCPILQNSLLPEIFPRALHMDAEYSPRLMERIPLRQESYPKDYYPFPAGAEETPAPPAVTTLLAIQRGPRPEGEITPLSQAEAAHVLLGAVIRNPAFQYDRALMDMMRLAGTCKGWLLRASTPEGAGERAVEVVTALST